MDITYIPWLITGVAVILMLWAINKGFKLEDIDEVVYKLVVLAEVMLPGEDGATKLDWVMKRLAATGITNHIDPLLLRGAIEIAVRRLKANNAQ